MHRFHATLAALLVALTLMTGGAVFAQDASAPNYAAWSKLADQAEQIVESGQANDARLQSIRDEVVKWRDQFQPAQTTNSTRIATLKDQIAALGPPPAEGQTESQDVADRRSALNDEMSKLQAPALQATEAYGRANGIVQQIDQSMRERQNFALIRHTPSPLNPANWAPALAEAITVAKNAYGEVLGNWQNFGNDPDITSRVFVTLGLIVAALLLLTRGRRWVDSLPGKLSARASERSRAAVVFGISLTQIAIPLIGILLATGALLATDLFGPWGRPLLLSVPAAGLSFFGGVWLTRRIFPEPGTSVSPPLPIANDARGKAAFRGVMLTLALALHQFFSRSVLPLSGFHSQNDGAISVPEQLSDASAGVWHFLTILMGAFFLFQLCNILRTMRPVQGATTPDYRARIMALLAGIGRIVAVVSALAAAAGYITGANAALWATVLTLGLVAFLIVLQDFIADLYAMAKGGDQSARDALAPMLISLALVVLSLPLFSLIWGARPSGLAEAWVRAQQGVSIGGLRLSPMAIVTFLIVFALGYLLTNFIQGAMRSTILPKTKLDVGGQSAVASIIGYVGIALATLFAISSAGIDLTSLAVVAGALSVGIGFGMQQVVSNFVSGIILLVERPIAVGDWIEVGSKQGIVKKMAVRATQIQTFDRTDVIVPNSDLITQQVTNWTRSSLQGRIIIPIGVAYGSDTRKVAAVLREIIEDQPTVMITPKPAVLFRTFGADSMNFEIRAVLSDINGGVGVTSDVNHEIARRFAEEGIEIPYAQRDIWLRNPEVIAKLVEEMEEGAAAAPAPAPAPQKPTESHRDDAPVNDDADDMPDGDPDNDGGGSTSDGRV